MTVKCAIWIDDEDTPILRSFTEVPRVGEEVVLSFSKHDGIWFKVVGVVHYAIETNPDADCFVRLHISRKR